MDILSQLSSQRGDTTETANQVVVAQCLRQPELLTQIAEALHDQDARLVGDCAEVLTKVAETNPDLVVPYASQLLPLLQHANTRVRWEATHGISLIAQLTPNEIAALTKQLHTAALHDKSTIVRDYSILALGNYALSSPQAAQESLPLLAKILDVWGEKQAHRVFKGLRNCVVAHPPLEGQVKQLIEPFAESSKGVVKKAYKDLLKVLR